jgi:hypothetical protein
VLVVVLVCLRIRELDQLVSGKQQNRLRTVLTWMDRGGHVGEQDLPEFKPLVYIALIFPFVSFHLQNLFYLNPLRVVDPFVGGIRLLLESS